LNSPEGVVKRAWAVVLGIDTPNLDVRNFELVGTDGAVAALRRTRSLPMPPPCMCLPRGARGAGDVSGI